MDTYKIRIYKIVNDVDNKIYIGSTKQTLSQRFNNHVSQYNCGSLNLRSKELFDEHGVDNCHIILIQEYDVKSREEQLKHERTHYDAYKEFIVNVKRPMITKIELNEYYKNYILNHPLEIMKSKKRYRAKRLMCECDCGSLILRESKSQHLQTNKHKVFIEANSLCGCCKNMFD